MKIFKLLKNPIIKLLGVGIILYFALFFNNSDPESLGNRLAPGKIKKDLSEAQEKSRFIISNVKMAQELVKEREMTQKLAGRNNLQISVEDMEMGSGEDQITCGDEVEISHGIYTKDDKQLQFVNSKKILIGEKSDRITEKNIIGMMQGGVRNINIPYGFKSDDSKLAGVMKFNATDLKYQITILSFLHHPDSKISCDNL